jgi:predicted ABC-type exoprotein transport system permease subunit
MRFIRPGDLVVWNGIITTFNNVRPFLGMGDKMFFATCSESVEYFKVQTKVENNRKNGLR